MGLPYIFGTELAGIPAGTPYLDVPSGWRDAWRWRVATPGKYTVGLVWAAGPGQKLDRRRSLPLEVFGLLADNPRLALFSLQRGPEAAQLAATGMDITNLEGGPADAIDTAAAIMNLDLVISADTMVAHLAGALGRPVWTVLPYAPDFRWMLNREDTPWYPTMRLFRQHRPGDWASVVSRVCAALADWS
jgi:hypothetical protein